MKKIIVLALTALTLTACGNVTDKTPKVDYGQRFVCTYTGPEQNGIIIEETLEMAGNDEIIEHVTQTLTYDFTGYMEASEKKPTKKQIAEEMEEIVKILKIEDIATRSVHDKEEKPLAGFSSSFEIEDAKIVLEVLKDMKKADFKKLNEMEMFKGYDREVLSLDYTEEVNALKDNGYICNED